MVKLSIAVAGMVLALTACEPRPGDTADQPETGATPNATDTATTPPGYSGMEQDTSAAGGDTGQAGGMDSFRLQQETGRDTGGHSGGEQVKPGEDTGQ